ncbi:MAG TPA: hypothetical protein VL119_06495 [Acidimicrobiia bacterium]|nr:hypothetical protein [Acidimicrobiia bacterium]
MVSELRPRGIGEILDSAVALYRARFRQLALVAAAVVVPVQTLSALVLLSAQPDRFSISVTGSVNPQYDSSNAAVQLAAVLVVALVTVLSTALIVAVCTRIVADAYIDRGTATREEVKAVRPRLFGVIGVSLIVLVSEAIGVAFCFVGLLVPLTVFAVAVPALILESVGVGTALGRSIELTRKNSMHVLGLVLTTQLLTGLLNVGLAEGVRLLLRAGSSTVALVIAQSIASAIAGVLTTPFVATAIVALYFDLRIRNEAFDVQLLMQRNDTRLAT